MHRIDWLHLEGKNQHGVKYREVLVCLGSVKVSQEKPGDDEQEVS